MPFATAIGVPVATVQPGSNLYQQGSDLSGLASEIAALRAEIAALKNGATAKAAPPTLLDAHCGKCHSGPSAKGGFSLSALGPESRGLSIALISAGRMPKDNPGLVPDIRLKLIRELTGEPPAAKSSPNTPPPAPPAAEPTDRIE